MKAVVGGGMKLHWGTDEVKINSVRGAWKGLTMQEILSHERNSIFHGQEGGKGCCLTEETLRAESCRQV